MSFNLFDTLDDTFRKTVSPVTDADNNQAVSPMVFFKNFMG